MSKREDGGPAFPLQVMAPHGDSANDQRLPGMSLRDWLAGQAITSFLQGRTVGQMADGVPENVASQAYRLADAMLAERGASE